MDKKNLLYGNLSEILQFGAPFKKMKGIKENSSVRAIRPLHDLPGGLHIFEPSPRQKLQADLEVIGFRDVTDFPKTPHVLMEVALVSPGCANRKMKPKAFAYLEVSLDVLPIVTLLLSIPSLPIPERVKADRRKVMLIQQILGILD
jgi:hypothetical protein